MLDPRETSTAFVGGTRRGNEEKPRELQARDRFLRQNQMSEVNGVERAAEDADPAAAQRVPFPESISRRRCSARRF